MVDSDFVVSKVIDSIFDPEISETIQKINSTWGGDFEIEFFEDWKTVLNSKITKSKIVHLTMYGENINKIHSKIQLHDKILVVVGAEKVPREIYELADYNIAVGNQPHSEVSALGVLLDRIQQGKQFESKFENSERVIIPQEHGKNVMVNKTTD